MANYTDYAKDMEDALFLNRWAPVGSYEHLKPTVDNLRWNIARANAAESELKILRSGLSIFKQMLKEV